MALGATSAAQELLFSDDFEAPDSGNRRPQAEPTSLSASLTTPYVETRLIGTDPDNDTLSYVLISPPSASGYASAYVDPASGRFYLTVASDSAGQTLRLSYRVSDGKLFSEPATITIAVDEEDTERGRGNRPIDPQDYANLAWSPYNDQLLGGPGGSPTLPARIDLAFNFPLPGNQGQQNSCVGWATAYALKSYQERVEIGWDLNAAERLFSPAWVYNQINGGRDDGSLITDAMSLVINQGAATLATMPYRVTDFLTPPNQAARNEAARFKASRFFRIENVAQIKAALANRQPVVIGFRVHTQFNQLRGPNSVFNSAAGPDLGGHAVTVTGYDDGSFGGAFRIINSYGRGWGDDGFFWMPYSFVPQVVIQAFALEDADNGQVVTPTPTTPPPTGARPDLVVTDWSINYDPKPRGDGTLRYTVTNEGAGVASAGFDINLMLSSDRTINANDVYVVYETVPFELSSGGSAFRDATNEISFRLPDGIAPGDYYFALWVDDLDVVDEAREDNNISLQDGVAEISNNLPDLGIISWYAEWDNFGRGGVEFEIVNQGNASAPAGWDVNLVLSPDQTIGNGNERFLYFEEVPFALGPGEPASRVLGSNPGFFNLFTDAFGNSVPAGTYYMALWIDDLQEVEESNELNNASVGWNTIPVGTGGTQRRAVPEQSSTRRHSYNGRALPANVASTYKVAIQPTPAGGRRLTVLEKLPAGSRTLTPAKRADAANRSVFPTVERQPMPAADGVQRRKGSDQRN